jgi:DNA-directed RNA polymerase subunit F
MALITPELTEAVAREDEAELAAYLRRQNVHYLASFERLYPEVKKALDAWVVFKAGQMELVRLR